MLLHNICGAPPYTMEATPLLADSPPEKVLDWIAEQKGLLDDRLYRDGAVLLRGFRNLRTAENFQALVQRLSKSLVDYVGGHTPRSTVAGKVVSSTDAPCHLTIGLHQEMSYLEPTQDNPDPTPDKVAFFCLVAPGENGQTPICDMRLLYRKLPTDLVDRFKRKGLMLIRQLPETQEAGYEATWPTVLGTNDRDEAESFASKRGWCLEWSEDGGVRILHRPSPVVKSHCVTGETVWFNQAHLLHKAYAPWTTDFLGPSKVERQEAERLRPHLSRRFFFHTIHADGSEIAISDLDCIRRVIAENMVMFDWQTSDVLICDNKLMAHGRQPYRPPRKILAALAVDRDR